MNCSKKSVILLVVIAIVGLGFCFLFLYLNHQYNSSIPEDYIAVFHGGVGEQTYETYIYEIDNNNFKYINVTSTTKYWGSADWVQEINEKGKVESVDEFFSVAKKHGAYSYVKLPNDDILYSIEEFTI